MKNLVPVLIAFFFLSQVSIANAAPIAQFASKSVVFLIKTEKDNSVFQLFKHLKHNQFQKENVYFLVKDISIETRILAFFAKRKIAPYDFLVRIDLSSDLTNEQSNSLRATKNVLRSLSGTNVVVLLTNNHQFYRANGSEDTDIAMAFINLWPQDKLKSEAQAYWFEHHGPLVLKIGLPPVIRSYTQVHADIDSTIPEFFDQTYQGFSFETIKSQGELFKTFVENPALRELNQQLEEDEANFTPPPPLFTFRRLSLD